LRKGITNIEFTELAKGAASGGKLGIVSKRRPFSNQALLPTWAE
jgi:hypothetical protein